MNEAIYNWYIQNGTFDDELLKIMQLECFNKRIEPATKISWQQLGDILSADARFNDSRLVIQWLWIFDTEYAVIEKQLLEKILEQLKGIENVWTIVAIVQAVIGLNSGFVVKGRRVVNGEITSEEVECFGFIVKDGDVIKVEVYEDVGVVAKDVVIGFAVFD